MLAATAFTVAEMLHATISWELSVVLAPPTAQGAYLGVHGLAQAVQRTAGPLAVTGRSRRAPSAGSASAPGWPRCAAPSTTWYGPAATERCQWSRLR